MRNKVTFDPKVDYYTILLLNQDASDEAIEIAGNMYIQSRGQKLEEIQNELTLAIQAKNQDAINKAIDEEAKLKEQYKEIDKAFAVLTYSRKEYDAARAKYLKSIQSTPTIDPADYTQFDITKDYYSILDVSKNASLDAIKAAYSEKIKNIQNDKIMSDAEKKEHYAILLEAFTVLANEQLREDYDKARAQYLKGKSSKKGDRVINIEEYENKDKNNNLGKIALRGLVIVIIAGALHHGGKAIYNAVKNNNVGTKLPGTEVVDPNYQEEVEDDKFTEPEEDKTVDTKVNYYGDINDEKLVEERANNIVNQFINNGMINVGTGGSYTVDEVKKVMEYVTGSYQPVSEEDALMATDSYLNFAIAPGNCEHVVYQVNYLGGEDSFKSSLDEMNASYKPLSLVDNMIFGECTAYPYLKWIENNYNKMVTTTDREECNRIFEETTQSIVEITCGKGYELDGVLYTKSDFTGLDKINAGNVLQIYAFNYQVFRTSLAKDEYSFNNTLLGLDSESNSAIYNYFDVMENYNAICGSAELKDNVIVNDSGEIVLVDPTNEKANFSQVNQMNTVNKLLQNYYLGVSTVEKAPTLN